MPSVTLTNLLPSLPFELLRAINTQLVTDRDILRRRAEVAPLDWPESAELEILEQAASEIGDHLAHY